MLRIKKYNQIVIGVSRSRKVLSLNSCQEASLYHLPFLNFWSFTGSEQFCKYSPVHISWLPFTPACPAAAQLLRTRLKTAKFLANTKSLIFSRNPDNKAADFFTDRLIDHFQASSLITWPARPSNWPIYCPFAAFSSNTFTRSPAHLISHCGRFTSCKSVPK